MILTPDQVYGPHPMMLALQKEGITPAMLAKDLKRGLKATVVKTLKVKGALPEILPKGYRVISTSGKIIYDRDGDPVAGDGETIIQWSEIDHSERTTNRIDAERLTGSYTPERKEHSGPGGGPIPVANMTLEEATAMYRELIKGAGKEE